MEEKLYTIRQVAEIRKVSERAIYKQIKTHEKELQGHIIKRNGKKWLDEFALELFQNASKNSAVVILEDTKTKELEELKQELERVRQEKEEADRVVRRVSEEMIAMMQKLNENAVLIAEAKLYLEQKDRAEEELAKFEKTIFGLYRKKND